MCRAAISTSLTISRPLGVCSPHAGRQFGSIGVCHVRYGKAMKGSPPRRRAVATVMPWAAGGLAQCLEVVRPCYGTGSHPAVWLTERGGRISVRQIDDRFAQLRGLAGPNRRADSRRELPCTAAEAVAAAGMGSPRLE